METRSALPALCRSPVDPPREGPRMRGLSVIFYCSKPEQIVEETVEMSVILIFAI